MSVRKELPCPSCPQPKKPNDFPKVLEKSKGMPNNLHRRKLITDSHVKRLTLNAVFVNRSRKPPHSIELTVDSRGRGERGTNNLEKHILNLGGFFKILRFLFEVLKIVQQNIFTSNEKSLSGQ